MGTQTVRYLQYLLSIDYFEQNIFFKNTPIPKVAKPPSEPNYDYKLKSISYIQQTKIVNKSDWIASITSLNGCLNGGTGPSCPDPDPVTHRIEFELTKQKGRATWASNVF
jgi:hypothetical protein